MYWYNQYIKALIFAGLLFCGTAMLCVSCRPEVKEAKGTFAYFDIKGFFTADALRLNQKHMVITKTVQHNGGVQTKKISITNWLNEFDLFINSDINKPAWSDSYTIQNAGSLVTYKAKTPGLKTRSIIIKKDGSKVKWILIYNHSTNMLYDNVEKLSYFPDSVYQISKSQTVRFLGKNLYGIKGVF